MTLTAKSREQILRYSVAVTVSVIAIVFRFTLIPLLGLRNPYHAAWVAVVFSSWYCGLGPSILSVAMQVLGVWYFFLPPRFSFSVIDRDQLFGLVAFGALSGFVVALGESNRRNKARLQIALHEARRNENRARTLVSASLIGILVCDERYIVEANDAFLQIVGHSRAELEARQLEWLRMTPPEYHPVADHVVSELNRKGCCEPFEKEYFRADGSRVPVLAGAAVLEVKPFLWTCFVVDLTRQKQTERELRTSQQELERRVEERTALLTIANESLRELTGRLLQARDDERRRLSRELHDSVGQMAAALKMNLRWVQSSIRDFAPNALPLLSDSDNLIDGITSEIRTISHLLHPPLLDEVGLLSAIRLFADGFSRRSGIKTEVNIAPNFGRLNPEVEIAVFRTVQESLSNVHRHSGSLVARVSIARTDQGVELEVADAGAGMSSAQIEALNTSGMVGVGLRGMRERLRQLGGALEVSSEAGETVVKARVPASAAAKPPEQARAAQP